MKWNARMISRVALLSWCSLLPVCADKQITAQDRTWWAFQPVRESPVPGGAAHPVDGFLNARLQAAGLRMAAPAESAVLLRRLTYILTGLPPSQEQLAAFLADTTPGAWERQVDALLASPRYGERWAHHWLDLVRYAESDGYKADDYRPEAWRYRDWVIRAMNDDMPYDEFLRLQIAGDELRPGDPEALVATGYLRCGIYEYNNRDAVGQRDAILNDITDTTSDVMLGLGLQCARCHDHKFDPLLQRDYYQLQAFFTPLRYREKQIAATPEQRADYAEKLAAWEAATADVRAKISALEQPYKDRAREDAASKFPPETQAIMNKPEADRTPLEAQIHDLAWRQVTYEWDRLEGKIKGADKAQLAALRKELAAVPVPRPEPLPVVYAAEECGGAAPPLVMPRREAVGAVEPGLPVVLGASLPAIQPGTGTGRRSALAKWLGSRDNPLTARVIVNRVWQQHFGRGLCGTTSDLGKLGETPSHPELLDWLAHRFMADGWSLKKLHRLILTCAAWRQGTEGADAELARQTDPENRLLWRWQTRRLDAEQIRDAIYSATGELDLAAGGASVDLTKPRRSVYVKFLRNVRDPLAEVFDGPQRFQSTPQRDTTTTPVQSLHLANSRTLMERSAAMARRLLRAHPEEDPTALVSTAWTWTTGSPPDEASRGEATAFIHQRTEEESAAAPADGSSLTTEPMPQREGRGVLLAPGSPQESLTLTNSAPVIPGGAMTLEAVVLLRSIQPDGRLRTIVSQSDGNRSHPGWLLGVSGQGSRRAPQLLTLILTGQDAAGQPAEEPVFSGLRLQMDRSYAISAAIHLSPDGRNTVTFTTRDLANLDEPVQTSTVPHSIASLPGSTLPLIIGNTARKTDGWDGLIDEIRIRPGTQAEISITSPAPPPGTLACWQFENPDPLRNSITSQLDITPPTPPRANARMTAVTDLCHTLFSSSAFLYLP